MGGSGTVDGRAAGTVGEALAEGDAGTESLGVTAGVESVGAGGVVVWASVGATVVPSPGVAESVGAVESVGSAESVGVAPGLVSATNAAGSAAADFVSAAVTTPGSTRLTSRPLGSEPVVPFLWTTCTWTPSEEPTHSGSEAPRT